MTFTLQELAEESGGAIAGDGSLTITGAASLAEATPGEITFYGNSRYLKAFRKTRASAAFVPEDFFEQVVPAQIRVPNPARLSNRSICVRPGADQLSRRDSPDRSHRGRVSLGENIALGPHVVLEPGVHIGDGTRIGANSYVGTKPRSGPAPRFIRTSPFASAPRSATASFSIAAGHRLGRIRF